MVFCRNSHKNNVVLYLEQPVPEFRCILIVRVRQGYFHWSLVFHFVVRLQDFVRIVPIGWLDSGVHRLFFRHTRYYSNHWYPHFWHKHSYEIHQSDWYSYIILRSLFSNKSFIPLVIFGSPSPSVVSNSGHPATMISSFQLSSINDIIKP